MHRKTVPRWIAALALVTLFAMVGAQPAAAANLGFMDRLASLWTSVAEREPAMGFWESLAGWFGGNEKAATSPSTDPVSTDCGKGIDPLGATLSSSPSEPSGSVSSPP